MTRALQFITAMFVAACGSNETSSPPIVKATYDMSGGDSLKFLIGRAGIQAELDQIEAGGKLGETWTYIRIPGAILDPQTRSADFRLNVDAVSVSHEFFGDDPTESTATLKNFRLDFVTSTSSTAGTLRFDRDAGGSVHLNVMYKGMSNVYGPSVYIEFEITTGFPIQPR